jgi:mediator of RNA polymerase II transcription subunit 12
LPTVEHIGYLTDLMEFGLNITGLLDMCTTLLKELPDIEVMLCQRGSSISGSYTTGLQLQLVAVFRRYHTCLLRKNKKKHYTFYKIGLHLSICIIIIIQWMVK